VTRLIVCSGELKLLSSTFRVADSKSRLRSLALLPGATATPSRFIETPEFHHFCDSMDPKFVVPGAAKIESMQQALYMEQKKQLRDLLYEARKLTLCLDLWTTKGMTSAHLGVTCTWLSPSRNEQLHALLSLVIMPHPHTSMNIRTALEQVIADWDIPYDKILLVITDNGSNMIAAFKNMEDSSDESEFADDNESVTDENKDRNITSAVPAPKNLRHLFCAPHTLQLVVKIAISSTYFQPVLAKVKHIVHQVKKSSKATEKLIQLAGKGLLSDCVTRWNSSLYMVSHFLELREQITVIMDEHKWHDVSDAEWKKLETFVTPLRPFREHTDLLQCDRSVLSNLILAVLDLECFLEDCRLPGCVAIAKSMKTSLHTRTQHIMNPTDENFEPLPAVASYLDPSTLRQLLSTSGQDDLLCAARQYILKACRVSSAPEEDSTAAEGQVVAGPAANTESASESTSAAAQPPPAKKFRFLASRLPTSTSSAPQVATSATIESKLGVYLVAVEQQSNDEDGGLSFWLKNCHRFPLLAPFALDILAVPASEA